MKVPPELISFLKEKDNFFIATHINPDGDAIGSSIALLFALESIGKNALIYDKDPVPEIYRFLPGHERFIHSISGLTPSAHNLILLDCNSLDRVGIDGVNFPFASVIDHHETENEFGDIKWVEPDAAATGMMVFYILKTMGLEITCEIAINLYAAIVIDTGGFRYSNTDAEVLRVAAELVQAGANPGEISKSLYEMWSEKRFQLLMMALNTLEIRNNVAFTAVTKEMFTKTGAGPEDTEHFSNFPRMMQDIRISVFFRETGDNEWKVSLRSRGEVNVARIAELFKGGGHKNAAGYKVKATLESSKELLLKSIAQLKVFQT
ncbi:MAG: bifunctional oligoribonuclease/PAP phosphatase NrnA [Nitrospira sp.]|nr:bifunctional oligoribonuclease/PAP phosphatase NrnA [Nitrospira sp.]